MSAFREPVFDLRDAWPEESTMSCNGCAKPEVARVLEVGSRMLDGRGSSGTDYRMCRDCTRKFLRIMAAEYNERMP